MGTHSDASPGETDSPLPDPPDGVAIVVRGARDAIVGASHCSRTGYYPTPVDDVIPFHDRIEAVGLAAGSLMILTAILRDATADAFPEYGDDVQALVELLGDAGKRAEQLTHRMFPGPVDDDDDD